MSFMKVLLALLSIMTISSTVVLGESLLVEAEGFDSHGGWSLDQQFMQTMGSPYLLAHGMGKPVADAETTVEFQSTGKYRMWVRTMDWVPGDWKSPGRFQVILDGVTVEKEFGTLAGWQWQDGGTVDVTKNSIQIKLHDLTGFEGRCDAIFFTNDPAVEPVNFDAADREVNRKWRNKLRGIPDTPPDGGRFDVVIVGGGISGCGAALAAEERGMRVALVNDRKALGGNASSDIRVSTSGVYGEGGRILDQLHSDGHHGADNKIADNARRNQALEAADGIKIFAPYRAYGVKMADGRIASVDAVSTRTGKALRLRSDLFIDCTGDGWIGYWAGAEYRYGRESYTEFGEAWDKAVRFNAAPTHMDSDPLELWSPKKPDNQVMGSTLLWTSHDAQDKVSFPEVPWAMDIAKDNAAIEGAWYWEHSANDKHQIYDAEYIRDHQFRAIYGSFYNAKQQEKYARRELHWVAYIAGKRESRRLMGDYIFTMKDMVNGTLFDDAVVQENRFVDLHFQMYRVGSPYRFLSRAIVRKVPYYYVPFRCLYSKNVDNLMMAGRCFSCSHVGLGGPRVENTCGQMGIATGYAASLCIQHRTDPRGVYENHIDELKEIIGMAGEPEMQTDLKIGIGGQSIKTSGDKRQFELADLPDELKGLSTVTISRGNAQAAAPGFKVTISEDSVVYLAVHDRGGYVPPKDWVKTDMKLNWSRTETDTVYKRSLKQGEVVVPGHNGTAGPHYGIPNMAFVKDGKVSKCEQ